jgi:hypothetical protein
MPDGGLPLQVESGAVDGELLAKQLLAAAAADEERLRGRALQVAFRSGCDPLTGEPLKLGAEEVGRQLGLPLPRCVRIPAAPDAWHQPAGLPHGAVPAAPLGLEAHLSRRTSARP